MEQVFKIIANEKAVNEPALDSFGFDEENVEDVKLVDWVAAPDKSVGNIKVGHNLTSESLMINSGPSRKDAEKMLRKYIVDRFVKAEEEGPIVEETNLDNIDEDLLKNATAMKAMDPIEILQTQGFVKGAIVRRSIDGESEYNYSYGIFTGNFYSSESNSVGLEFTDGRHYHQDYCTLVEDVNKEIIRMVDAEQGRIMEDAQKFIDLINQKLHEIIYG